MMTANLAGIRVEATPGARAECPSCRYPVLAKCGEIVTWHWAHIQGADCDDWAEPDSEWHHGWQAEVPIANREITMRSPTDKRHFHRADIVTDLGDIVELQHSSISVAEIRERQDFYGPHLLWLFDGRNAFEDNRLSLRYHDYGYSFRWKHPRRSLVACRQKTVLLDIGDQLLWIQKIHIETGKPTGGWGYLIPHEQIVAGLNSQCTLPAGLPIPPKPPLTLF